MFTTCFFIWHKSHVLRRGSTLNIYCYFITFSILLYVLYSYRHPHLTVHQNPLTAIFLNISHYLSLAWYPFAMCTLHMPSTILMSPLHIVSIVYLIFDFCSIRVGYLDLIVQVGLDLIVQVGRMKSSPPRKSYTFVGKLHVL